MKLLAVTDIFQCSLSIYVPAHKVGPQLHEALTKLAGGYTVQFGIGSWEGGNEQVAIYNVLCHRAQAAPIQEALEQEARRLLDAGEQAVLIVKDGHGSIYSYIQPFANQQENTTHGNQS